jgi:hypothetical protein
MKTREPEKGKEKRGLKEEKRSQRSLTSNHKLSIYTPGETIERGGRRSRKQEGAEWQSAGKGGGEKKGGRAPAQPPLRKKKMISARDGRPFSLLDSAKERDTELIPVYRKYQRQFLMIRKEEREKRRREVVTLFLLSFSPHTHTHTHTHCPPSSLGLTLPRPSRSRPRRSLNRNRQICDRELKCGRLSSSSISPLSLSTARGRLLRQGLPRQLKTVS